MKLRMESRPFFSSVLALTVLMLAAGPMCCIGQQDNAETIVMIRHGEKPGNSLGQLTCKGLNRSLALPDVLLRRFGKPDFIYAPNPSVQISYGGVLYSYVRPLATIEPTAVRVGLPVNTQIGYTQIGQLQTALTQPAFAHARIFVSWEHAYLNDFARQFLKAYGDDPSVVPEWPNDDYDTIYIFQLAQQNGKPHLSFRMEHEGLNGSLSDACPGGQR
ncbi:MAG: histidine phosphatase family protein [Silvibacterium sp.]